MHTVHQFIHQFMQQFMPRRPTRVSHEAPTRQAIRSRIALWSLKPSLAAIAALVMLILAAATVSAASYTPKAQLRADRTGGASVGGDERPLHQREVQIPTQGEPERCSQAGKFACPAIQNATATITITNRFATNAQNDVMTLKAEGLPKNTGFDLFLVQHSPLDSGFGRFRLWMVPVGSAE